jgi:diguanylate cyclase (GGDEF)-like protein
MKDLSKAAALGLASGALAFAAVWLSDATAGAPMRAALAASVSFLAVCAAAAAALRTTLAEAERIADGARQERVRVERDFQKLKAASEDQRRKLMEVSSLKASLSSIAQLTGQSMEPKEILLSVLEFTERHVDTRRCSVWRVDSAARKVWLEATRGWSPADEAKATAGFGEGVIGQVIATRVTFDCETAKRDPTLGALAHASTLPSMICAPLAVGGEVLGVLNIEEFVDSHRSSIADDLQLTTFMASIAAMAVKNALAFRQTKELANRDGLTGLFTHRYFQEKIDQEVKRSLRYGDRFAVVLTDIDHFKKFNDTYGHQTGDMVLRETAACFGSADLDKNAILSRYGGEEFVVVLPGHDKRRAGDVAERLRRAVEGRTYASDSGPLRVTISAGVAAFPEDTDARATLIEMADHALYRAKKGGRNQIRLAVPEDREGGGDSGGKPPEKRGS